MTFLYRSRWTFTDATYCKSVNNVAFSPDGVHLAYSSGENLCVLSLAEKRLLFVVRGRSNTKGTSTVTSLAWLPNDSFCLLCTFSDGLIINVTRSSVRYPVTRDVMLTQTFYRSLSCMFPVSNPFYLQSAI